MKPRCMMITFVLAGTLGATVLVAQEGKPETDSDLHRRALEALERLQKEKRSDGTSAGPATPAAELPAEPARPATPPGRLPSFSEAVPPPAPPRPEPPKAETPKPPPQIIRIQPQPPQPAAPAIPVTPPPATAPPGARPVAPAASTQATTYTIQSGDTFSAIALKLYGDESRWIAIAKANPLIDPVRLKVGQVIKLPDLRAQDRERDERFEQLRREVTAPAGTPQTVMVEPGDNLSAIAQRVYGRASLWRQIYDANRDQLASPDELKVGMKLKIPPASGSAPTTAPSNAPPSNADGTRG